MTDTTAVMLVMGAGIGIAALLTGALTGTPDRNDDGNLDNGHHDG